MTYLRPYVTGSNDAILNGVVRTTAVLWWGRIMDQGVHRDSFGTPPRGPTGCQSRGLH
jgi:hypothetical protein